MLSVIMPAYNENECLAAAVQDVVDNIFSCVPECELMLVDDGSTDDTGATADTLAKAEPRITVKHQPNQGHGPALVNGIRHARYNTLFLMDSDRQVELTNFKDAWKMLSSHDAVFGVRRKRRDSFIRLLTMRGLRIVNLLFFGVRITDANCPFKLVKKSAALDAIAHMPAKPFLPSALLAVYIRRQGKNIGEIDVVHHERMSGQSTYRQWRLIKAWVKAVRELAQFRCQMRAA